MNTVVKGSMERNIEDILRFSGLDISQFRAILYCHLTCWFLFTLSHSTSNLAFRIGLKQACPMKLHQ